MTVRSFAAAVVAVALSAAATGCSGSGDGGDAATTETAPTTTVGTMATTAPVITSTTAEPSTTTLSDEEAVRLVHTRFMTELQKVDERANGPEAILPLALELTTGPLLARIEESVQRNLATGERSVGDGYESNIFDVLLENDRASVLDCSRDTGVRYSPDGEILISAAEEFRVRETRLVRIEGIWFVEEFVGGGGGPCDPATV